MTQTDAVDVPLQRFTYPQLPYKADSGSGPRGTMQGYNICVSAVITVAMRTLAERVFSPELHHPRRELAVRRKSQRYDRVIRLHASIQG